MNLKNKNVKKNLYKIKKINFKSKKKKEKKEEKKKLKLFLLYIFKLCIIMISSQQCFEIYRFYHSYYYCYKCIENTNNLTSNCFSCPNEFLFRKLHIESEENTLSEILKHNKSIARYGDGEFGIIIGNSISFQRHTKELAKRLLQILNSHEKNLLVGIYYPYKEKQLKLYLDFEYRYWKSYTYHRKFKIFEIIKQNKKFYSTGITRFYLRFKDKSISKKLLSKLRQLWEGRDIILVEGEISRQGVGNDLFNNANSIKRIICPEKNSFDVYNKILNSVLKLNKNNLILISLGPTATVLAYDLSKLGYQAIDIGHTDLEYELLLRNETKWIFKNEKKEDVFGEEMIKYNNQIIEKILN